LEVVKNPKKERWKTEQDLAQKCQPAKTATTATATVTARATAASAVKPVIFGHLPSYIVRQVGGIRLDRSDDFAFSNDLITFRATFRVDGNLPQTSHVKFFKSSNS
jgi:HK97 family phage major capsid protein